MNDCEKCGRSWFRGEHECGRPTAHFKPPFPGSHGFTPGGWPYYYAKLPGMSESEAQDWALEQMVLQGVLSEVKAKAYRTDIEHIRYVIEKEPQL